MLNPKKQPNTCNSKSGLVYTELTVNLKGKLSIWTVPHKLTNGVSYTSS